MASLRQVRRVARGAVALLGVSGVAAIATGAASTPQAVYLPLVRAGATPVAELVRRTNGLRPAGAVLG